MPGGSPKVSVIAALYNTGPRLAELIDSLDAQSLPQHEFEVILVDDGSTDDTYARAAAAAASRPNLTVERIPNSGWPGRPRNVGLDRARGAYVFFADHDDRFGPHALASMHGWARRHDADIVAGKVVRVGGRTPHWPLWQQNAARAELTGPIVLSRTIHKLYRREFLLEHGIRFREGRVRLEDYDFTAKAVGPARRIAVLADEPCYWWIQRNDGSNNSSRRERPGVYWRYYADSLRQWHEHAATPALRDAAIAASVDGMFWRLSPDRFLRLNALARAATFRAVHKLVVPHIPTTVDARLPLLERIFLYGLRTGQRATFERLLRARAHLHVDLACAEVGRADGHLTVRITARAAWETPADVPAGVVTRTAADAGEVAVTVRHRTSKVEWPTTVLTLVRHSDLDLELTAAVDLTHTVFGGRLEAGSWDVFVRASFLGQPTLWRVVSAQAPRPAYVTRSGHLAIKVPQPAAGPCAASVLWSSDALLVHLPGLTGRVVVRSGTGTELVGEPVVDGFAALPAACFAGPEPYELVTDAGERLGYGGPPVALGATPVDLVAHATADRSLAVRGVSADPGPSAHR